MASFNLAINQTLLAEGGATFTDDPVDAGGATKYGISQRAYPKIDIRNLTEEHAKAIYKMDYWDRVRADDISSQEIAANIFDTAVNMGVRTASRLAQTAASIKPADGIIGPKSIAKINELDPEKFIPLFTLAKIGRYAAICNKRKSQKRFLLGWVNRALGH